MNVKLLATSASHYAIKRVLGPFRMRRRWLDKTQWYDEERLDQIQLNCLKRLVRHCYKTVPYYRKLMDKKHIRPECVRTLQDIQLFPVLSKQDVLAAGDSLVSTRYPKWMLRHAHTGGTTGTPMDIYRNPFSVGTEHAFVRRQWTWAGIGLHDSCAYLTGRIVAPADRTDGRLYAYDPFARELILSTYHLSAETAKEYLQAMKAYGVDGIVGYPSSVFLLARRCLDGCFDIKLKAALTSSETITETMRQTISSAFGCGVFDFYGSAERVCYIHTCERGRYHIVPEYGRTELIPEGVSDPSRCRVIATGFWNYAMPLIRYDTGDVVVKSEQPCRCGRAFPVVESIEGRQGDVIRTPSRRELGCAVLTHLLYGTANIVESQIIQDRLDRIVIEYVPSEQFAPKDLKAFKQLIVQHLPAELNVELKQVGSINKTESGKLRPVVSSVSHD
ncbi:MAG: phenylacetate--CoA ligase family protein [Phycisphaerae bacterium]|nr:phenylacetate--CoA ligase family protein [Phycisphaerae bacterium]